MQSKENMKKGKPVLYLMHISWFWIKQRPQFLAEKLSKQMPVIVGCLEDYNCQRELNKFNSSSGLILKSFASFKKKVFGNFVTSHLNFWLKRIQLGFYVNKVKIIWFSSPQQFVLVKPFLRKKHFVIYDCMDDISEFYTEVNAKLVLKKLESSLCERADLIITSAQVLRERLKERYNIKCNIEVINNGINFIPAESSFEDLPTDTSCFFDDSSKKYLVYIGTISEWFDMELIIEALNNNPTVQLIMVGPSDLPKVIHPQISYTGGVLHSMVNTIMKKSDALIMPFKITELVRAVNPVKAYEYISSGKPVILSYYEETQQFEQFAYLYKDEIELKKIIEDLNSNNLLPKKTKQDCIQFAMQNTWEKRVNSILEYLPK